MEADVEPEELAKVAREAATVLAGPLEKHLASFYGQNWIVSVNERLRSQGKRPIKSLSDSRACLRVFIFDPSADNWTSDDLRQMADELLKLANKAHHDEPLDESDLELARSILDEFRSSFLPARGDDYHEDLFLLEDDARNGGVRDIAVADYENLLLRRSRVQLPPNLTDGTKLRVPGKGKPGRNDGDPGDLIITIRIERKDRLPFSDPSGDAFHPAEDA